MRQHSPLSPDVLRVRIEDHRTWGRVAEVVVIPEHLITGGAPVSEEARAEREHELSEMAAALGVRSVIARQPSLYEAITIMSEAEFEEASRMALAMARTEMPANSAGPGAGPAPAPTTTPQPHPHPYPLRTPLADFRFD